MADRVERSRRRAWKLFCFAIAVLVVSAFMKFMVARHGWVDLTVMVQTIAYAFGLMAMNELGWAQGYESGRRPSGALESETPA